MFKWPGNPRKQRTTFGSLSRSELMSRVRGVKNKTTDERLAHFLRRSGLRGWRRHKRMVGRPDFIWLAEKLAVFVDGCFWHGHSCGKNVAPRTNAQRWRQKIEGNRARDIRVAAALRRQGWRVIRIWECQLAKKPDFCVDRLRRVLGSKL